MAGVIVIEAVTSPVDFYILLAPGGVLGAFVGVKVAQLGNQRQTKSETATSVRTLIRILVVMMLICGTVAYLRALNTLRSAVDEWAFLAFGGLTVSFLVSVIPTVIGTWLFYVAKRRTKGMP